MTSEFINIKYSKGKVILKPSNISWDNEGLYRSTFMYEENNVTIQTNDDVSNLKRNDLVRIENKFYRVDSIQKSYIKKQRQFHRGKTSASYYISLRG